MNTYAPLITFMILFHLSAHSQAQEPLILRWKTNNPGISDSLSITIPTSPGFSGDYNYEVDWDNDGIYDESNITGDVSHTYDRSGIYSIRIKGQFPAIYFNNEGDKSKLINIDQWGDIVWKTFLNAFYGCDNLEYKTSDEPLIEATSMTSMFRGCSKFNGDIGGWDVSNITDMSSIFNGASSFNQELKYWDVSNVYNMHSAFSGAISFNQNINDWDVSNVNNMGFLFSRATSFNQDIGDWNVSKVNFMYSMFSGATSFNQDIGGWDVSRTGYMFSMFNGATSFNQYIGDWDVSNVAKMFSMFMGATSFNQDIGKWNISSVIDMSNMLDSCGLKNNNYDNILMGWSALPSLKTDVTFGVQDMNYCYAGYARPILEGLGWKILGDAMDCTDICAPGPVNLIWKGAFNDDWGQNSGWILNLQPTSCFLAIIPSGQNVIIDNTLNANAYAIAVANGASFTIYKGGTLECLVGN